MVVCTILWSAHYQSTEGALVPSWTPRDSVEEDSCENMERG